MANVILRSNLENLKVPVCHDCYATYSACDICGELFHATDLDGDCSARICPNCWEDGDWTHCAHCGRAVCGEEICYSEESDMSLCSACYEKSKRDQIVREWNYKPAPLFRFMRGKDVIQTSGDSSKKLYLGVELEADGGDMDGILDALRQYSLDMVYFKGDGSLSSYGIEAVSHPCELGFHLDGFGWENIIDNFLRCGYTSHNSGNCGIHVHVNNLYLATTSTGLELAQLKILTLFDRFWTQFERISRRKEFSYCHKNNEVYNLSDVKNEKDNGRYYAINIENYHTTEFRLWRGSLKVETFFATLEITAKICEFVKTHNVKEVITINWNEFKNHLTSGAKYAKNYIAERGL